MGHAVKIPPRRGKNLRIGGAKMGVFLWKMLPGAARRGRIFQDFQDFKALEPIISAFCAPPAARRPDWLDGPPGALRNKESWVRGKTQSLISLNLYSYLKKEKE